MLRSTLASLALVLLLPAGSMAQPPDAAVLGAIHPGSARIQLAPAGPEPARAEVPPGDPFTFVNATESTARVVFDKRSAKRVNCTTTRSTGRRGQFLVEAGTALSCSVEGAARYSVYRQGADGSLDVAKGRIDSGR